ncbi:MAG: hypothetical protein L0Z53_15940 [Acidobacteriales bacterium]|nr:hypothetical protein [Terriglobales bacterium]
MKTRNTTTKLLAITLALGAMAATMVVWNACFGYVLAWPGIAAVPPTPSPTYSFDTGTSANQISIGGSPADANVAASSTHICVTARAASGCYTKGGSLVSLGAGFQARPYTAKEFFEKSGISTIISATSDTNYAKDGRVVFDHYRKRFFLVFQSREAIARLLIAVSKSEDPRDGWWIYADTVGSTGEPAHDYQRIGVNYTHLLVSNNMVSAWKNGSFTRTRHLMYTVADLVDGKPYSRSEWTNPKANNAIPCVHDSYTFDAFWIHRDDDTHVSVWAVRNGKVTNRQVTIQTSTATVNGTQVGGAIVNYGNIGRAPQNCQFRDGRIMFVSNDGHTWSKQSSPNNAVRLVRLNVSTFFDPSPSVTVEIDRIFGRASAGDSNGAIYDYGWPAVAANAKGDIVVGSIRSHSTIYPELRASVWFAGQPDISPGVSLATSSSPLSEFHMAGASADPITDGVYLAQQYGTTSPSWRIRVVKMLGKILPDVIATQVQPPATIARGVPGNVTVTVMNQGDGPMPASTGKLYLSTDNVIDLLGPDIKEDPLLATFSVPALAPNQVATLVAPFTISTTQAPSKYFVGVAVYNGASEYNKTNNVNPFQAGNHGNAPIIVK